MQAQAAADAAAQLKAQQHANGGKEVQDTVNFDSTIRESVAQQFERMRGSMRDGGCPESTAAFETQPYAAPLEAHSQK
eukprot:scaffold269225_cov22-Tisochrysis_lutea.AAC.1